MVVVVGGGGGGGLLSFISQIGMCLPQGYGFWSEKVYRLCPFGLKSGMVFEGTAGANEHIYRFSSK